MHCNMVDKIHIVKTKAYPTTAEGIAKFYDEWAETYEEDLAREGYDGPERISKALWKVLPDKDAEIMDMACGTGKVAVELRKLGYNIIDGVDISTESLKISKEKGLYRRLICEYIGTNRLDIKDDTYDGLVLSGALALGHLNQDCFPEFIRIVKPGGLILFDVNSVTMNTFERFKEGKFDSDLQKLSRKGLWEMVSYEIENSNYNQPRHFYTFKVL